jgi:hypothetical protein
MEPIISIFCRYEPRGVVCDILELAHARYQCFWSTAPGGRELVTGMKINGAKEEGRD